MSDPNAERKARRLAGAPQPIKRVMNPKPYNRECRYCGTKFETNRSDKKFCSQRHREQYHTERIRQALKEFGNHK